MNNFVAGVMVGHAQDDVACTGCTVLIGPFRAAVDVRGMASGSRELDVLSPLHVVEKIDAILLTGGSAFGLAAADGVMSWLEENGRGYQSRLAKIPIVPAAVIYDLGVGSATRRPDAAMGRAACEAAVEGVVVEGRVGCGAGATAGKIFGGIASAARTGLGAASLSVNGYTVSALAVVNPLGDVLSADGRIIAGARMPDGTFADSRAILRSAAVPPHAIEASTNTTVVAVATDAPLSRADLNRIARMASTGVARRIAPVNSPFDGDVLFAVSTADTAAAMTSEMIMILGSCAADVVEQAIERAATITS